MNTPELTSGQKEALEALSSNENVFITGSAGTGKSFVLNHFLKTQRVAPPVLASTGAAAVLVNGRTFHSYFGLGIMKGGLLATINRGSKNSRVKSRVLKDNTLVIDEISMISGDAFYAAHKLAQIVRQNESPFGGIRLIVVGDFLQLPPVTPYGQKREWLFMGDLWRQLNFKIIELTQSMRSSDEEFVGALSQVRQGQWESEVDTLFKTRVSKLSPTFEGTILFGRRDQAESYNETRLEDLDGEVLEVPTQIKKSRGVQTEEDRLIGLTPLPPVLKIKIGALVMIRKNDADHRYVNGTLATIVKLKSDELCVRSLNGVLFHLSKVEFEVLDGDGKTVAKIVNFPVSLAWATTIHKAQGASVDRLYVRLKGLWESGQAYVALSRARSPEGLFLESWEPQSIKTDPQVIDFYNSLDAKV